MSKCILKDGDLEILYDLEFIKSEKKLEVGISLTYRSNDGNSAADDACGMSILKLNEDTLLDRPYSLGEMILCRIEGKVLEYVKDNLKKVLSKVDIESSVDSYSLKYIIRAKVSYDDGECIITAGE